MDSWRLIVGSPGLANEKGGLSFWMSVGRKKGRPWREGWAAWMEERKAEEL